MSACHAEGREFESRPDRIQKLSISWGLFLCLAIMFTVYIIYSHSLDLFYRGQTNNISERIKRHNSGSGKYTKSGVPWKLIWTTNKQNRSEALILEKKLKNLSRKKLAEFMKKYEEGFIDKDAVGIINEFINKNN